MLPDTSIDQFYSHILRLNNENTAGKYRLAAQKFVVFCATNHLALGNLPRGVLSLFSETLTAHGLSPSSVSVMTAGAKRYLKWLQDKGAIVPTTFSSPELPHITREDPNALKDEDLLDFFRYAARCPEPARTALLILPYCGLRSNELTSLMLKSIRKVEVPTADGGKIAHICFYVKGKGGDYRTVPLLFDGRPLLVAYMGGWRRSQPGSYLFPMSDGTPLSNRTLRHYVQWIREQMKRAGRDIRRLTPHALRRTYVTTLWRAGLDVPTLAKIAGHKNIQTTMTHYLAVQPEDLAGAVGRSGAALIAKGPYADAVRSAQVGVDEFLSSLKAEKF